MNFKPSTVINVANGLDPFFGKMVAIPIVVSCSNDAKNYILELTLEKFCVFRFYIFIHCTCMSHIVFCNKIYTVMYILHVIYLFLLHRCGTSFSFQ